MSSDPQRNSYEIYKEAMSLRSKAEKSARYARYELIIIFWAMFFGTIYTIYKGFSQGENAMGVTMSILLVLFVFLWSYPMTGWDPFEAILRIKRAIHKRE